MTTIASAATTLRYLVEAHGDDYAAMAKNVADVSLTTDVQKHFDVSFDVAIDATASFQQFLDAHLVFPAGARRTKKVWMAAVAAQLPVWTDAVR